MVGASSLAFPGGSTLSAWRRQLAPYHADNFWVGYLFVHFLEAPVLETRMLPADDLSRRVLQGLALTAAAAPGGKITLADLDALLGLGPGPLRRLLHNQEKSKWIVEQGDSWTISAQGRHVLESGQYPALVPHRRVFPFVEILTNTGHRLAAPHWLPLEEAAEATCWTAAPEFRCDSGMLANCLDAPLEFRQRYSTPEGWALPASFLVQNAWNEVLVDRTERVAVVLALASTPEGKNWLGFPWRPDSWLLQAHKPILRLPEAATDPFPALRHPPTQDDWRQAWRVWCQGRQLPQAEVDACALEATPRGLGVHGPARFLERLGQAKNDLLKGDLWLLAGADYLRAALPVEWTSQPTIG